MTNVFLTIIYNSTHSGIDNLMNSLVIFQFYLESVKGGGGSVTSTPKPTIKTEKAVLYLDNKKSSQDF